MTSPCRPFRVRRIPVQDLGHKSDIFSPDIDHMLLLVLSSFGLRPGSLGCFLHRTDLGFGEFWRGQGGTLALIERTCGSVSHSLSVVVVVVFFVFELVVANIELPDKLLSIWDVDGQFF